MPYILKKAKANALNLLSMMTNVSFKTDILCSRNGILFLEGIISKEGIALLDIYKGINNVFYDKF